MIGPATRADADIDYTFAQIGIEEAYVSYEIVCGNISSATGVYAIEEGLVPAVEPVTTVRVHNTNTDSILIIKVPVSDGAPLVEGDFAIDGVPGTGAEVVLDYSNTSGGATGRLLPTGNVRDRVQVPSLGRSIEVSIVDIGTICVYFRAADLGLTGSELPGEIPAEKYVAAEEIRLAAAALCHMPQSDGKNITPFQIMIAPPLDYRSLPGEAVRADGHRLRRPADQCRWLDAQGLCWWRIHLHLGGGADRRQHPARVQLAGDHPAPGQDRPPQRRAADLRPSRARRTGRLGGARSALLTHGAPSDGWHDLYPACRAGGLRASEKSAARPQLRSRLSRAVHGR